MRIKEKSFKTNEQIHIELINMKEEEGHYLKELNIYIIKLLDFFWVQPKLVADLLMFTNISDLKNNLAPFFSNFFFENYLSPYYIQDNLLYVLTIVLKKEIMNLKDKSDYNSFLNETCAGILLGELKYKNELGTYFRKVINKTIEKLELNYWPIKLIFQIPFKELKKSDYSDFIEEEFDVKTFQNQSILNKYFINLTKEDIIKEKEKNKDHIVSNIFEEHLNLLSIEDYSENRLFFQKFDILPEIINAYKINFCIVIDCINQLISDIQSNVSSFPYSLKCICKIISVLIQRKFPNLTTREKISYIGRYIFTTIFIPLLNEPSKELLLTRYLIFDNTENNAKVIGQIFQKLIMGELYTCKEKNFCPFNVFFIQKMKNIVDIYDNLIKVNLPEIIEKVINNNNDVEVDFDNEEMNKDEVINNKFICFQFDDIMAIIDTLGKNQEHFFKDNINIGLRKTFEKLTNENSEEIIQDIRESDTVKLSLKSINEEKSDINITSKNSIKDNLIDSSKLIKKETHYYFYISEFTINKAYEKYFELKSKNTISMNLVGASEDEIIKTNIQKVKDCITIILENFQTLSERRFLAEKIRDTKSIFKEIKQNSYLNDYYINNIPSKWYLNILFEYLEKLPQKYKDNDYDLLLEEFENDIHKSIKFLNFQFLSEFNEKLIFSKKNLENYKYMRQKINSVMLNQNTKNIIKTEFIPITIYFDFNKKEFEIKVPHNQNQDLYQKDIRIREEKNKTYLICKTINAFTIAFPNFVKFESLQDEDLIELLAQLHLAEKINDYFTQINNYLLKIYHTNENDYFNYAQEKIFDFIMIRIHEKIFPIMENRNDNKLYKQSFLMSWAEPKHFIKDYQIMNVNCVRADFHHYLTQMLERKSPFMKFESLGKIFDLISKLARLNRVYLEGPDSTLGILLYLLIKEKPMKLYSNCEFMQLFLLDKRDKREGNQISQLIMACDLIINISFQNLLNVTLEEFSIKRREASNMDM